MAENEKFDPQGNPLREYPKLIRVKEGEPKVRVNSKEEEEAAYGRKEEVTDKRVKGWDKKE